MCDTFVALAPATADGSVVFGKSSGNSLRTYNTTTSNDPAADTLDLKTGAERLTAAGVQGAVKPGASVDVVAVSVGSSGVGSVSGSSTDSVGVGSLASVAGVDSLDSLSSDEQAATTSATAVAMLSARVPARRLDRAVMCPPGGGAVVECRGAGYSN